MDDKNFADEVRNWLYFFLGYGLPAGEQSNGHQNPRTSLPRFFPAGSSEFICLPYPSTYHRNYYRHHLSGFRACAMHCAASCQPLGATGRTSLLTYALPVLVKMRSHIWDTRCTIRKTHRFMIVVFYCVSVTFKQCLIIHVKPSLSGSSCLSFIAAKNVVH